MPRLGHHPKIRYAICTWIGAYSLLAQTATPGAAPGPPSVKVTPVTARPGDTLKLIATTDNCPGDPNTQNWLNKDSLTISGSDVVLTYRQSDQCTATFNAVVAAKPVNRELTLTVTGVRPQSNPPAAFNLGSSTFQILDSSVMPPGPIPPGLKPQVDVMWNLMSEKGCADEFGTRLAKSYYCINVVLGNNSGYSLIIAAVGFLRHQNGSEYRESTASYLSTRATVQEGQVMSARALTVATLQAAGSIVAGTAAFSGNAGRKGRLAIWSTLLGTVLSGVATAVIPDHTLKEDTALDDAALRDGKLIPNNSPVRFAVFVDRDLIEPLLLRTPDQLSADAQDAEARAAAITQRASGEQDPAKLDDLQKEARKWREWAREMRIEATAHNAADYTRQKGHTIINPIGRRKALLSEDLIAVRRALGNLIIVGDQIQYLQRVQVDSAAVTPGIEPTPVVTSQSGTIKQGVAGDVVLLGTGLAKVIKVTPVKCGANINPPILPQPDSSGNSLTLKGFTVTGCTESAIPLIIDNGSAASTYTLSITPAPQLDFPSAPATYDSSGKIVFKLTGQSLDSATPAVTLTNGQNTTTLTPTTATALSVSNASANGLDVTTTLTADYAKAGTTAKITVTTPLGGPSAGVSFTLQAAPPAPTLDDPPKQPTLKAATTLTLPLTGTALTGATKAVVILQSSGLADFIVPAASIALKADATTPDKAIAVTISGIDAKYAVAGTTASVNLTTAGGTSQSVKFTLVAP